MIIIVNYLLIGLIVVMLSWLFEDWEKAAVKSNWDVSIMPFSVAMVFTGLLLWPLCALVWIADFLTKTSGWLRRLCRRGNGKKEES